MTIDIREMEETDGDFVLKIRNDDSTRMKLHNSEKFTLEQFSDFYKTKKPYWFIASCKEGDFGYFRTDYVDRDNQSIQVGMDIHPKYRGRGLARPSYERLFDQLRAEGFKMVWLEVLKSNDLAHNLYKKIGFVETERREHGEDESIRMEKWII